MPTSMDRSFERVVVSGIGIFDEGSSIAGTPFGFWIQQQTDAENDGAGKYIGSIHIDILDLSRHLSDLELNAQIKVSKSNVRMIVVAPDGTVSMTLQLQDEPKKGPQNVITIDFRKPRLGVGTSTGAVVNIPRPECRWSPTFEPDK